MRTQIKSKLFRKLKSSCGETITETLVAILIISLAMIMLAGSLVTAAKVNRQVKDANTAFTSSKITTASGKANIKHSSSTNQVDVNVYTTNDGNKYVYYEAK